MNDIMKFAKALGENYGPLLEEMNKQLETPVCYYPWVLVTTGFHALNAPHLTNAPVLCLLPQLPSKTAFYKHLDQRSASYDYDPVC